MEYDHETMIAFLDLHTLNEKAKAALACIAECSTDLSRTQTLASIAEDYLTQLSEAIEATERSVWAF